MSATTKGKPAATRPRRAPRKVRSRRDKQAIREEAWPVLTSVGFRKWYRANSRTCPGSPTFGQWWGYAKKTLVYDLEGSNPGEQCTYAWKSLAKTFKYFELDRGDLTLPAHRRFNTFWSSLFMQAIREFDPPLEFEPLTGQETSRHRSPFDEVVLNLIREAWDGLPPEQGRILKLVYEQGHSERALADDLSLGRKVCQRLLKEAEASLKEAAA